MAKRRRRRASHTVGPTSSKKKGFPGWVKPVGSMIGGGLLGLLASSIAPDAIAPYTPAIGIAMAKFAGGGGWGKYLATAGVLGGLTFLSKRRTVQVASGALKGAKNALASGGGGGGTAMAPAGGATAAQKGAAILKKVPALAG
jgi:hypothetical protein